MLEYREVGSILASAAKGIYKPQSSDFALSVRVLSNGHYEDKDVEHRSDGSWVCQYHKEHDNLTNKELNARNRGMLRCMEENIPIGFMVRETVKPATYFNLGLGFVVDYSEPYFTIEGVSAKGEVHRSVDAHRARAIASVPDQFDFDPSDLSDHRQRQVATIARRRGQAAFRFKLLDAYGGRCCVTGCNLVDILEAAHITPYRGDHSNHVSNGLLLRVDIHTLFDLGLIAFNDDGAILLEKKVMDSEAYRDLSGLRLRPPTNAACAPNLEALRLHREWCAL